ncbi:MAG: hypothetical protein ACRC06_09095 [Waterburya sp.]
MGNPHSGIYPALRGTMWVKTASLLINILKFLKKPITYYQQF